MSMKKLVFIFSFLILVNQIIAQTMTPELLWSLGRVNALGVSPDEKQLMYTVTTFNKEENKSY